MRALYDIVRFMIVAIVAPVAFAPAVFVGRMAYVHWGAWGLALTVPTLSYLGVFLFMLGCALLCRIFVGRLTPGRIPKDSPGYVKWGSYTIFQSFAVGELKPFLSTYLVFQRLYYGLMGAKMGKGVTFAQHALVLEPCLVEVGDEVTVGGLAIIATHIGHEGGEMELAPVRIGSRSLVGGFAVVSPGVVVGEDTSIGAGVALGSHVNVGSKVWIGAMSYVRANATIGDGARISFNSVVEKGTVIPPGEHWAGNPARKIGMAGDAKDKAKE